MLRLWREVFWGKPMNPQYVDRQLAVPVRFILPSAVMALMSAGLLVGAGPAISATNHAADSLLNVKAYQSAVLGDDAVGVANTGGAGLTGDSHDPAEVPDDMIVHHDDEDAHATDEGTNHAAQADHHTDSHNRQASASVAGPTGGQE